MKVKAIIFLLLLFPFSVKVESKKIQPKKTTLFRMIPKYIEPSALNKENVVSYVEELIEDKQESHRILSIIFHESNYLRSKLAKENNNIAGLRHRQGFMRNNYLVYNHWKHCVVELVEYEKKYKAKSTFRQSRYVEPLKSIKW